MEIIDFNVHVTPDGHWFGKNNFCNVSDLISEIKNNSVTKAVIMPLKINCSNEYIASLCNKYPNELIGFGTISQSEYKEEIEFIISNNLVGCKFHPRFQNEDIWGLHKKGVLRELENNNIPISICCWPQVNNSNIHIEDISPLIIDKLAKAYPKLLIIIMHMGGHNLWDAVFVARSNENVYLECSYFLNFFKNTSLENDFWSIVNKIDEKVIYGSDFPEINFSTQLKITKEKASEKMKYPEKLFSENAKKIVGIQ
jgi:uncharacterized protein